MSHPNPEDPDYNWEQFGGGRYVSPPTAQTPTRLRTHIKPIACDSGLVKNAQGRRAKLVTDSLDESGESSQTTPHRRHPSRESQRHPSGPREPPLHLDPRQPQPNIILPQPPLATTQGTHTPVGLNSGQDLHADPLNAGLSADALGVLGLPRASPIDDFSAGTSTTFDGTNRPFTADPTFDFSSLDVPWDPVGGDFALGNKYDGRMDLPETRVIPPTPAKTHQPSFGAQLGAQDAFPSYDDMGEFSAGALVGRRTDEVNVLLEENFKAIDDIFNDLVAKSGLPLQQVSHAYHKARGRIHSAFNHWNTYGHYLKAFRVAFPDSWQEILETFEQVEVRSVGPQTVSQRTQEFSKIWRKVVSTVDTAAAKHGFEAVFIICGKVVNQDASLGYIHETPGAESFWQTRCRTDEDAMIGHLKAHVYNLVSLAVVEDTYPEGAPSINEDELPPKRKSAKVSADAPDAMKVDPDALEVSDIGDWQLQVDVLQCIKGGITALFKELGGKLTVRSGNFPWKKLRSDLDRQGFIIEGYPEDILMPGETRSTNARSKGINDLDKREQIILAEALKSGTLAIKRGPTGPEVKDNSRPVIIGEAPPPHSIHLHGRRLLANGVMDREGPSRLRLSAATTKVRKPNDSVPIAPPIVVENDSSTSAIVRRKNIVVSVDIPPAHPFKEELPSRKRKARTIGSTHRLKRRVPSSDIESIEQPQPKGKGKETVLQKERARVRYRELTSDSEEEKKEVDAPLQLQNGPVRSKPGPKPKKVIPGSTAAAKQVAFYEGGMLNTYESSRAAGPSRAAEPSGASDVHKSSRAAGPSRAAAPSGASEVRESSRAVSAGASPEPSAPSSAPLSPSPQFQQPPHSLVPPSYDQRSPALQTAPYNYGHGRTLPAPSYGQHLDVPQGRNYPDPHRNQITYQRTAQPLLATNQSLGVKTAGYSHAQYAPRNDVYTHLASHHANAAHTEAYMTRPPAHQQHLENHGTPALVFSQQQQYSDIYGRVPARTPARTHSRAPTPQQHRDTYDTHVPAHQPPASQ
ncbi:hypothetical protein C8R48DRAFT_779676 [Suillus tomentosus]|nr:hypothetical protein C8R48DRAFT_779676 [Suillus tomentosus]